MRRARFLMLIAAVSATAIVSLNAGQRADVPAQAKSRGPAWLPRFDAVQSRADYALTPAERAALNSRFAEYERLFAAADSLGRPQGFIVLPSLKGSVRGGRSGNTPQFIYELLVAPRVQERTAALRITENPEASSVWGLDSGPPDFSDSAGAIYGARPQTGPLPGTPPTTYVFDGLQFDKQTSARINSVRVVLTSDGVLPWADVPRERVLNILIAEAEKTSKEVEHVTSETMYQRWVREALARRQTREQLVASMTATGAIDKARAEKTRADMERAEREAGEVYKKAEGEERERNARSLADVTKRLTAVRGQQAAMTAAERAMPAWVQLTREGTYSFAPPGTAGFDRLIADRPDFYRFKGSRVQVRTLMVYFHIQGYAGQEAEDRAVIDSYRAFDWAAAQRVLNASR